MRKLPAHIEGTWRQWTTRKRKEFRDLEKAFDQFRLGCVYTPLLSEVHEFKKLLEEGRKKMSPKVWKNP